MKVVAFARAAGGAAAIAPVLQELERQAQVLLLAKDYAARVFRAAGLDSIPFLECSEPAVDRLLTARLGGQPDVVFTSAASLPQLDMTEHRLWGWARAHGVPSVAVLDQWQHYALRFSGLGADEHLAYLPDRIAAMDEYAKHGLIEAGIPAERVVVTGQPAFDRLVHLRDAWTDIDRKLLRHRLGVGLDATLLCFVAESFADTFGDTLGYTEQSVLRDLMAICRRLAAGARRPLHLAVKLHPENDPSAFAWVTSSSRSAGLRVTVHGTEVDSQALLLASDVVIGMTSVLLIESIVLGRPTVSFQPTATQADGLIATVLGAIPLLDRAEACEHTVQLLLQDREFLAAYLRRQTILQVAGSATAKVVELVQACANGIGAIGAVRGRG